MSILVKWGRERLHVPLPPPHTKLALLRHSLAEYTQLPEHAFKLVHAGAVMKDDSAPISSYSIRQNSTIAIIGGSDLPPHNRPSAIPKKQPEPKTEQGTISQIRSELDKVRNTLVPSVDIFLFAIQNDVIVWPPQNGSAPSNTALAPLPPLQTPTLEHTRLAELLLQSLLRLDAITADGSWTDARLERKGAVKEVQGVLDKLDGEWGRRNSGRL